MITFGTTQQPKCQQLGFGYLPPYLQKFCRQYRFKNLDGLKRFFSDWPQEGMESAVPHLERAIGKRDEALKGEQHDN